MKTKKSMIVAALAALLAPCFPASAQTADEPPITVWFQDDDGRHFIPRGFAVVTEQRGVPTTDYSLDDYRWKNEKNEQDYVVKAWRTIWERYKDDDSVFGYDLLNEPHKGSLPDYRACEKERLVPLYRRLIDALRTIDSKKWTLVQPLLREKEDRPQHDNPFVAFMTPIEREGVVYAPHTYEGKPENTTS